MAKLRIGGACSGQPEVELKQWTVSMLIDELARLSNFEPNSFTLIFAGRVLKESSDNPNLAEKNNAKVLVSRINFEAPQQLQEEEQCTARLALLKKFVAGVGKRYADGDYHIEIQDQTGQEVFLDYPVDRSSAMMGLLFHARAKQLIQEQSYIDAAKVLIMGEEAFSRCHDDVMEFNEKLSKNSAKCRELITSAQEKVSKLEVSDEARRATSQRKRLFLLPEAIISDFVFMGFERSKVISAVAICGNKEEILMQLPDAETEEAETINVYLALLDDGP